MITKTQVTREFGLLYKQEMLPINQLQIDRRNYQREEQGSHVQYISESFDELAFGSIIVARRKTGVDYIVDGQQRTLAAKLAGYQTVPALVFASSGPKQEAILFNDINKYRKRVSVSEVFRAALSGGAKTAVTIDNIVERVGLHLNLRPTSQKVRWPYIAAISAVERIYKASGVGGLEMTLQSLVNIWPGDEDILRETFLIGFWMFIDYSHKIIKKDLMVEKFSKQLPAHILRAVDKKAINLSMRNLKNFKLLQLELIGIYNKGLPVKQRIQ